MAPQNARTRLWRRGAALLLVWAVFVGALAGCSLLGSSPADSSTNATPASLNHTHDILVLQKTPNIVLLATHYGLYRSTDAGMNWTQVAGGAGQTMDGLMMFKLAESPNDPLRVYTLAIRRDAAVPPAAPGLYTSVDGGAHWSLATPLSAFPNSAAYTISAGAQGSQQVFAIDSTLGAKGLFESDDAGAHWHALPALPVSDPSGILSDPQHPNHLLFWSRSSGLYASVDGGQTWAPIAGIQGGIYAVSMAQRAVYAAGDEGLYASTDAGNSFALVDSQDTFSTVIASDANPLEAYALGGTQVYRTTDGGHTWTPTAPTSQHPGALTNDPANANLVFVAFSYPVGVAKTENGGKSWTQLAI